MRTGIVTTITLMLASVALLESTPRMASADPIGDVVAIRRMKFNGDNIATAVRANIERGMPHVESGTSSASIMMLAPENNDAFPPDVYFGVGYSKTDASSPKWWTLCGNCGAGAGQPMEVHGSVVAYSTPVRIVIQKFQQGGQTIYDILWFKDNTLIREENNVPMYRGATSIEVGGGIYGDDENDIGVAGITGIRYNGAYEPCGGMGEPSCLTGAWIPDDDDENVLHGPPNRYFTAYWPQSGFPVGGNIQLYTDCHLSGNCEYP